MRPVPRDGPGCAVEAAGLSWRAGVDSSTAHPIFAMNEPVWPATEVNVALQWEPADNSFEVYAFEEVPAGTELAWWYGHGYPRGPEYAAHAENHAGDGEPMAQYIESCGASLKRVLRGVRKRQRQK